MKHARPDYDRIQDPGGKIPDDEPVFIIRGQDLAAVPTLLFYATLVETLGADPVLVAAVRAHADRMNWWQHERCRKVPDL